MFKIIDRTLTAIRLDGEHPNGMVLSQMCELIAKLGVDYIEVSVPILKRVGQLPIGPKYILKIESIEEMKAYNGFDSYVWKSKDHKQVDKLINEIQINDTREINMLNRYADLQNVRITGLDEIMCTDYEVVMKKIINTFKAPVDLSPQNSYYCATAIATMWLLNGGKSISVSLNGIGGYAPLEEVIMAIKVIMHKKIHVDLSILPQVTKLYEEITQSKIYFNKPVVGKNIFNVEAGIHADGINKNPLTYEPYDPTLVGKVRRLVIGKHSGTNAIKIKLGEIGLPVLEEQVPIILEQVQEESIIKRRSLTDKEFIHIVKGVRGNETQVLYS